MKTRSRRTVLDYGKFLKVEEHTVELDDGRLIEDWTWVVTPDYINVIIITGDEQFLFFRQPKYGYEGISLSPIGGYIEPGESPLEAAKREMLEEVGYSAPTWIDLGSYRVDANRGAGTAYTFMATGAKQVREPDSDDFEAQEIVFLSRDEVMAALKQGEFKVLAWANITALALLYTQDRLD